MAKKKTLTKKEKVGLLADKLSEAIDSCNFEPTEELDLFAESVALLVAYWGKVSDWSPIEKASYFGYVTTTVMEKGLVLRLRNSKNIKRVSKLE